MRKIFYLFLFQFSASFLFAQAPGGVAGSVLWLKADAGATPSLWTDNSTSANNFSQPTAINQPVLNTNRFNFYPSMTFDGAGTFLSQPSPAGFPTANTDRTIIVVANTTDLTGYRWILAYGNVGSPGGTCQVGMNGNFPKTAALANDFYANDFEFDIYWNAPANSNGVLTAFTLNTSVGSQYDRGTLLQTQSISGLSAPSVNAFIGSINTGLEFWSGDIAEVIMFPTALSAADQNLVESYLAMKYGFTLGTTTAPLNYTSSDGITAFWTGSATYQNDVFGIGTDNGSGLVQSFSNSMNSGSGDGSGQSGKGNLVLGNAASLTDQQFLMIGNDGGALTEHLIAVNEAPAIAVGSQRVVRNWKVQNTGAVGPVDLLSFDISGLALTGGATATNYRLMIDNDGDGDYNTGTQTFVAPTGFTGIRLSFAALTLPNGAVFTIITQGTPALLPAVWRSFNINLQNNNNAILTWTTSDETDVDYYTVEYSLNGTSYSSLGNVAAKNSGGINTYTFTQDNLPAGTRFYRIRRVDKNRSYSLSQFLKVQVGGAITKLALNSNPILRDRVEFIVNVTQNQDAFIRVVDISGRVLAQQNKGLTTGTNAITTSLPHLHAGMYFLQVRLANEIITKKFIKQ